MSLSCLSCLLKKSDIYNPFFPAVNLMMMCLMGGQRRRQREDEDREVDWEERVTRLQLRERTSRRPDGCYLLSLSS